MARKMANEIDTKALLDAYKKSKVSHYRPMVLDTVSPEIAREIIRKRREGWSYKKLARWIQQATKGKVKVSYVTVREWLNRRQAAAKQLVFGSQEFKDRVAMEYLQVLVDVRLVCDGLIRRFEEIIREKGPTSELVDIAKVMLQYYDAIQRSLIASSSVRELEADMGKAIKELNIKYRSVVPPSVKREAEKVIDV